MIENSSKHPIQELMITAMTGIKDMVDVSTIVGKAIEMQNNILVIPVSKLTFGFAAGGSEFKTKNENNIMDSQLPFGGGSGATISVSPVAFLVVQNGTTKLMSVTQNNTAIEKLVDYAPEAVNQIASFLNKNGNTKNQENTTTFDNQ